MKMTLIAHGTRGDVQPLVILGARLSELGHEVVLAVSENYRRMAEQADLKCVPIPIDLESFLESDAGRGLLAKGRSVRITTEMAKLHHARREAFDAQVKLACDGAEAILGNVLTMDRGLIMADKLRVPFALVNSFPLFPTSQFPSPLVTTADVPFPFVRRLTHELLWSMWERGNARDLASLRRDLRLDRARASLLRRLSQPDALTVSHFSKHLVPKPNDWPAGLHLTGFWRVLPQLRRNEAPPEALVHWLDAGPRPVFVGFGSMPVKDPRRLIDETAKITRARGLRAVINVRDASHTTLDVPEHLFVVGAVDHDWLMPKCIAAVHHGGAGTVAASLSAGLPTMICSVWADQPFWGKLLERRGIGCHVPFPKLDAAKLDEGLAVITHRDAKARAEEMSERLREEGDGSRVAARLVSEYASTAQPLS